jgi:hypothetical protein
MNSQILGNYGEHSSEGCEYLKLVFSPLSAPLHARWRNNGLSADFLGDYVLTFLPKEGSLQSARIRQVELKHAVTYVSNELLENAMKYHEHHLDIPIDIHLELTSEQISISASNGVNAVQAERYKAFIGKVLQGDAGDQLIKQLEEGARCAQTNNSCLGLLTMINDYGAQLGWCFDPDPIQSEFLTVTTRAVLAL